MKIALFHNLPAGGAKRALYEHARHLYRRGHTLDAYVPASATEEFLPLSPFCRSVLRPVILARDGGSGRSRNGAPGGRVGRAVNGLLNFRRQLQRWDAVDKAYARLAQEIDAGGYDLVYAHHCRYMLSPTLLRHLKTPSVYFCQDTLRYAYEWTLAENAEYEQARDRVTRRRVRGQLLSLPQGYLLHQEEMRNADNTRAATLTLANSAYSREAILRAYGIDARVCYLGVDSDFFRPDPSVPRDHCVLSVGNLGRNKRHDFIIDAVGTIPEDRRPGMQIVGYEVIAGDSGFGRQTQALGPVAQSLLRRAEEQGVALTITKEVTDDVLRDAYRRAGVTAFAPHLEPFGFVTLESMACGAPVVGVSEGGLRETIQDGVTGLLAERDAEEYGAALDRVLTNPALAQRLSAGGLEAAVCRWNWERSTDTLEGLFALALRRAGHRPQETDQACASP